MFARTKKRAFPSQILSVRRLRPNIKTERTNQFLGALKEDNLTEEEPENDGFFNLEDDVSSILDSDDINDNDTLLQTANDSDNDSDDSLSRIENDNDNDILPQTEDDNDDSLPQTVEDESNAYFEPIQGEYGPYFSNFTEQMLFFGQRNTR